MKNRKNKKKLIMITLLLCLLILLSGCSLAVKNAENDTKDILIGAFITDDYLDLFDMDAYLDSNASKLLNNPDTLIDDSGNYTNPLYAKIDRHKSRDAAVWDISFNGIKGLNVLSLIWTDENDTVCHAIQSSDGVCDVRNDLHESDNSVETALSATIYTVPQKGGSKDNAYYVNPVYQTADGKIYAVSGSGVSSGSPDQEGDTMSINLDEQTDSTEKWNTKTEKNSVTVKFSSMFEPVKITIFQMNEKNQILEQESYIPGKLPEQLTARKDTAYFLVETEKKTPDGNKETARSIYEPTQSDDEESLETFYAMDDGIVSKQFTQIVWENQK